MGILNVVDSPTLSQWPAGKKSINIDASGDAAHLQKQTLERVAVFFSEAIRASGF